MTTPPKLEALHRWRRVAAKDMDGDLIEWLAGVARALLEATEEVDTNRRRLGTIKAVGLNGRVSMDAHAVGVVVNESAQCWPPDQRTKITRAMVGMVTNRTIATGAEIPPEALRKRIARARKRKA